MGVVLGGAPTDGGRPSMDGGLPSSPRPPAPHDGPRADSASGGVPPRSDPVYDRRRTGHPNGPRVAARTTIRAAALGGRLPGLDRPGPGSRLLRRRGRRREAVPLLLRILRVL